MVDDVFWSVLLIVCLLATASLYIFAIVSTVIVTAVICTTVYGWRWVKRQMTEFIDWIENGMYLP